MRNDYKGIYDEKIRQMAQTNTCPKCKSMFLRSENIKCPYCGCKLKKVKNVIIWN